jgi:hypothetical protein
MHRVVALPPYCIVRPVFSKDIVNADNYLHIFKRQFLQGYFLSAGQGTAQIENAVLVFLNKHFNNQNLIEFLLISVMAGPGQYTLQMSTHVIFSCGVFLTLCFSQCSRT